MDASAPAPVTVISTGVVPWGGPPRPAAARRLAHLERGDGHVRAGWKRVAELAAERLAGNPERVRRHERLGYAALVQRPPLRPCARSPCRRRAEPTSRPRGRAVRSRLRPASRPYPRSPPRARRSAERPEREDHRARSALHRRVSPRRDRARRLASLIREGQDQRSRSSLREPILPIRRSPPLPRASLRVIAQAVAAPRIRVVSDAGGLRGAEVPDDQIDLVAVAEAFERDRASTMLERVRDQVVERLETRAGSTSARTSPQRQLDGDSPARPKRPWRATARTRRSRASEPRPGAAPNRRLRRSPRGRGREAPRGPARADRGGRAPAASPPARGPEAGAEARGGARSASACGPCRAPGCRRRRPPSRAPSATAPRPVRRAPR